MSRITCIASPCLPVGLGWGSLDTYLHCTLPRGLGIEISRIRADHVPVVRGPVFQPRHTEGMRCFCRRGACLLLSLIVADG